MTRTDTDLLREWINSQSAVAWIIKAVQDGKMYTWRAVDRIDRIEEQTYSIWHKASGPLTIPSGRRDVPDGAIADPFQGWTQKLERETATSPWFGANLPGPYTFDFREKGGSAPNALARSGFQWAADRYRAIGLPAHPEAKRWWRRLQRFIADNATPISWPDKHTSSHRRAYAFNEAYSQIAQGPSVDDNPFGLP